MVPDRSEGADARTGTDAAEGVGSGSGWPEPGGSAPPARAVVAALPVVALTAAQRTLADRLDAALPQTQCTRCGYPDCRAYADAIAAGLAPINRCPPGGGEGIARLAQITGQPVQALDAECGDEGPLRRAVIDEAWCIGCTLCIKACPVDCIVGAHKRMHTVIGPDCTGCELCIPACPVDCIVLVPDNPERSGWSAWSEDAASRARQQYGERQHRQQRLKREHEARLQARAQTKLADLPAHSRLQDPAALARKRAVIEAAMAKARTRRDGERS